MSARVLIFIVAYCAEAHIQSVLERIPKHLWNSSDTHVLCIDDASGDQSAQRATEWAVKHDIRNITVLRNPVNQGYGGNQKIGYRFAIDGGFDFVVLLHGDGQYAPELLPKFIDFWKDTNADVVIGSRMQSLDSARKGGMPLYKIAGNRTLTVLQNALTGQSLSEYHSGYRAFSTKFLSSVPFEINTNDFHFDTEILLQAFNEQARVVEFPIPTFYGDEICRVNGLRYARDVVAATLQYRLTRVGMFCSLKYRQTRQIAYDNKVDQRYSAQAKALAVIKRLRPKTLANIGSGQTFIARGCEELGIDVARIDETRSAGRVIKPCKQKDLDDDELSVDVFSHDATVMLDVIEHLSNPESFLLNMRNGTAANLVRDRAPVLILATPNVAFAPVRLNLLLGRFNYADRGILNISHKRLFTASSLRQILTDCGYEILEWEPVPPPFELVFEGKAASFLSALFNKLAKLLPTLFAFQFLVVVRPKPGVRQLVEQSEEFLNTNMSGAPLQTKQR